MFSKFFLMAMCSAFITIKCQNLANINNEFTPENNDFLKIYENERILSGGVHSDNYHESHENQRYSYDEPEFYIFLLISLCSCNKKI